MRMLRNPDEAEDSTQEIFLHVFRRIQGFRGDSASSTWLHRVAVNTVLMRLRGRKMAMTPLTEMNESGQETSTAGRELGGPDLRLEGYVDRVSLEKAIEQLPPRCKLMFVLYDIQGYAHREIAKLLGCSVGNAKSQLHKARVRLRQRLRRTRQGGEREGGSGRSGPDPRELDRTPFLSATKPCGSI
jgi:RNA polymerase sigma-70 factor (ECF subfamily)